MPAHDVTYLDWAASAPPDPAALEMARDVALAFFANPSSPHATGHESEQRLQEARAQFARAIHADPREIIFTSGGTESNTSLLLSLLDRHRLGGVERQKSHIVITAIEHASIFEQSRSLERHGISCTIVHPRPDGHVDPAAIADALTEDTLLVSAMLVNNETGAIQDIAAIAAAVRDRSAHRGRKILLHADAVQALGKIPFSPAALGIDAASFSGHKIGAPRGIGALYLKQNVAPGFLPKGGGQESGRRPGTENLPGICAFALAAERRVAGLQEALAAAHGCANRLMIGLRQIKGGWLFPLARSNDDFTAYSPYIVSAGFPPLPAEVVVRIADENGFCISTGSACSSKKKDRTRVLESMGIDAETARSAVRISIGSATTPDQIDAFLAMIARTLPPLLSISRGTSG
jgi:cysteine desulfurase